MSYKLSFLTDGISRSASRAFTPTAPSRRREVELADERMPNLLDTNSMASCFEFTQHAMKSFPDSRDWGHILKNPGEAGYTTPAGIRVSHDVIAHRPTGRQVDIVGSGGDPRYVASPTWGEGDPAFYRPHNIWRPQFDTIWDSGAGPGKITKPALLYLGWFPMMTALRSWRDEFQMNFDFAMRELNPDGFMPMLCVEGRYHIRAGRPDPWRDAMVDPNWPDWDDRFIEMLNRVGAAGKKVYPTVYGGRFFVESEGQRKRFHERIVRLIARENLWGAVLGFHMMNEFRVNHWEVWEVKAATRHMRGLLPAGMRLSSSSPHAAHGGFLDGNTLRDPTAEEMQGSFDELYGDVDHAGANAIDIHIMRDRRSRWSEPGSFNAFYPDLVKSNHEPPGVGTTNESTADPKVIGKDADRTGKANWDIYFPFFAWSVFNGHLPVEYWEQDDVKLLADTRNIREIFSELRLVRGNASGGGGGTVGGGGSLDIAKLPGRARAVAAINFLHEFYKSPAGLKRTDGLVGGTVGGELTLDSEGIGAWVYDVYLTAVLKGKTEEEARQAMIDEVKKTDEWKIKHS